MLRSDYVAGWVTGSALLVRDHRKSCDLSIVHDGTASTAEVPAPHELYFCRLA